MSLNIGELVGYIKLDHSGVGRGITAAQRDMRTGMDKIQADAKRGGQKAGQDAGDGFAGAFRKGMGELGRGLVGAFAIAKVVEGIKRVTLDAQDMNETLSMAGVVFGKNTQAMRTWADAAPRNLGLATEAALRTSATFADMFSQIGYTQDAAVAASRDTLQFAADLGSFKNLDTGDVLDRISASLRGEYDSLQLLIPNINAARVQQEALAATGKKNAADLTAQEKATATLAIIQKDGAAAAGDYARTADQGANATKTAAAEAANLRVRIGQELLPAWTAMVVFGRDEVIPFLGSVVDVSHDVVAGLAPVGDAVGGMVDIFQKMPGPVQQATLALIALVLLRSRVESFGTALQTRITSGAQAAQRAIDTYRLHMMYAAEESTRGAGRIAAAGRIMSTGATLGLAGARAAGAGLLGLLGGPWGVAFAGATLVLGAWAKKHAEAAQEVRELTDAIQQDSGAVGENAARYVAQALAADGMVEVAQRLGVSFDTVVQAAMGSQAAFESLDPALEKAAASQTYNSELASQLSDRIQSLAANVSKAAEAERVNAVATDAAGRAQKSSSEFAADFNKAMQQQSDDAKKAAQAILDLADAHLAASNAQIGYEQALDDVTAAIAENGKTAKDHGNALDLDSEKGRANASALNDLAGQAQALAESQLKAGDSTKTVGDRMEDARAKFIAAAEKMGLNKPAAEKMATAYGLTRQAVDDLNTSINGLPAQKQVAINVAGVTQAQDRLRVLQDQINKLHGTSLDIVLNYQRALNKEVPSGIGTINSAYGNILHFARGGIEDHRAHIARAGTPMRVFNEPETGGEGYIPLANDSRRPRAVGVLGTIADEFGYSLVPKGAMVAGGGRSVTNHTPVYIDKLVAHDLDSAREQALQTARTAALGPDGHGDLFGDA